MITEDYVSFETAKLLNEKGFDEYCLYIYMIFGSVTPCVESRVFMSGERSLVNNEDIKLVAEKYGWEPYSEDDKYAVLCPSLQMAMKWLREVHKIDITVDPHEVGINWIYQFHICQNKDYLFSRDIDTSYENCAEAAIKYCLENLI